MKYSKSLLMGMSACVFSGIIAFASGAPPSSHPSAPARSGGAEEKLRKLMETRKEKRTEPPGASASKEAVFLYNRFGKREVGKADKTPGELPGDTKNTTYAHALFRPLPDQTVLEDILATGGIRKISGAVTRQNKEVYEIWLVNLQGEKIQDVRKRLADKFPEYFFNLESYSSRDKLSPKLLGLQAFSPGEKDEESGLINATIGFFPDVPERVKRNILQVYLSAPPGKLYYQATREKLLDLANINEISFIAEYDSIEEGILNAKTRSLLKVDEVQAMDYTLPPTPGWLQDSGYFGRGVIVGVYDTGIDTVLSDATPDDFMEFNGSINELRNGNPSEYWYYGSGNPTDWVAIHGTHVAGIIGGNGWRSEESPYLWRGMAPKVKFLSKNLGGGRAGHVNNHSHTHSTYYSYAAAEQDGFLHDHDSTVTQIFAAGNDGDNGGFYSLRNNSKNPIIVGSSYHDTALVVTGHSSMGPTRDGRIKPDLLAPGTSYFWPDATPETPTEISLDYIRIKRDNGTTALAFEFGSGSEGWTTSSYTANMGTSAGKLNFDVTLWNGRIVNNSVSGYTSDIGDTLLIGYRIQHPDIPSRTDKIRASLSWGDVNFYSDSAAFLLPLSGTSTYHTFKAPLADLKAFDPTDLTHGASVWPDGLPMTTLQLAFRSDPLNFIQSTNVSHPNATPYAQQQGTSMATPAVTGVAALVLEKWAELWESENLYLDGPWNSTVKAILIHTATDLVKEVPDQHEARPGADGVGGLNADLCQHVSYVCTNESASKSVLKYYVGPDFATGYGLVNAEKAIQYTHPDKVLQDSLEPGQTTVYEFDIGAGVTAFRTTLAWDDLAGSPATAWHESKLVNDLDMRLESPSGQVYYPWALWPPPQDTSISPHYNTLEDLDSAHIQPAYKGNNNLDNVEVVDVAPGGYLESGTWRVIINGYVQVGDVQDFSLVSDYPLTEVATTGRVGWLYRDFNYLESGVVASGCAEGEVIVITANEDAGYSDVVRDSVRYTASGSWAEYNGHDGIRYYPYGRRFYLCKQSVDSLPRISTDYAVPLFSEDCPTNGVKFARVTHHLQNLATEDISPSEQWESDSTVMYFCYVKADENSTAAPPWKDKNRGALHSIDENPEYGDCEAMHKHLSDLADPVNNHFEWPGTWPSPTSISDTANIKDNFFGGSGNETDELHYYWNTCQQDIW